MQLTLAVVLLAVFAHLLPGCSSVATSDQVTKDQRKAPAQSSGSY